MSLLVVGSMAFDSIKTPFGTCEQALGGAANYFSMSAQFFAPVCMVGVVGEDYPQNQLENFKKRGIDISGVEIRSGKTFHWKGFYEFDLNQAHTLKTDLNVYADFKPCLSHTQKEAETVFLANIHPALQWEVWQQIKNPQLVALDTMNYWIENAKEDLLKIIQKVDILFINDAEIRQLTGEYHIVKAVKKAQSFGPKIIIVKRGEYGAMLFYKEEIFFVPAYPLEELFDPTGAGDTFAGGFMGLMHQKELNLENLKRAMQVGTIMASFVIEDFSFMRLEKLRLQEIQERLNRLQQMGFSSTFVLK